MIRLRVRMTGGLLFLSFSLFLVAMLSRLLGSIPCLLRLVLLGIGFQALVLVGRSLLGMSLA